MTASDEVNGLVQPFEAYLREERMRGKATVKRYVAIVRDFALYLRSAHPELVLAATTHREITLFLRETATKGDAPSPTAWNMSLAALRAFHGYLVRSERLRADPTAWIERHRVASKEPVPLSLEEFLALLEAAEKSSAGLRNAALVLTLYHTAIRVQELVSLDLIQVDRTSYVFRDVRTKGGKWLSAPFNDMTAAALEAYLATRPEASAAEPLFLSRRGSRLSVRAVQELLSKLGPAAGIARPVTPHLLRHSSATELAELGTPLRVVQEVCGHASVTTTERYVHVRSGARTLAIQALGRRVEAALARKEKSREAATA